jgi:beta-alanine degradation protein BauB
VERDPVITNPGQYRIVFENDRVRVLEYRDRPGDRTAPHRHPDSVMVTLSSFRRRLIGDGRQADVELGAGEARWLAGQEHAGENIGETETRAIFIELKEPSPHGAALGGDPQLGPSNAQGRRTRLRTAR